MSHNNKMIKPSLQIMAISATAVLSMGFLSACSSGETQDTTEACAIVQEAVNEASLDGNLDYASIESQLQNTEVKTAFKDLSKYLENPESIENIDEFQKTVSTFNNLCPPVMTSQSEDISQSSEITTEDSESIDGVETPITDTEVTEEITEKPVE